MRTTAPADIRVGKNIRYHFYIRMREDINEKISEKGCSDEKVKREIFI